ncbi:RDD family protein, partial [Candidatus Cyanaurora vandensis]
MTNVPFERTLLRETTDAPLWPRFAAWGLDLAVEIAVPYLLAVTGYVSVQGFRSLVNATPFDGGTAFADALFPQRLWEAFQLLEQTGSAPLDQTLTLGLLGTAINDSVYILPVTLLLWFIFFTLNRLILPSRNGKTLGKQLLGLKIVAIQGKLSFGRLFLRHGPGQLLSSFFLLGYIYGLISPERRTWHDHLAGTRVVQEEDFTPVFQRDGTISSALIHLEAFVLAVFLTYFLKLFILWLRILGVPVPAFLLPEPPPPVPPLEFVLVGPAAATKATPQPEKVTPPDTKRVATVDSVAGGLRQKNRPVDSGSAGRRQDPVPTKQPTQSRPQPADRPAPP